MLEKTLCLKKLLTVLAFAASLTPAAPRTATAPKPASTQELEDPRSAHLSAFFNGYGCPEINQQLIPNYLDSADRYKIDYRLLVVISLKESTCLKRYPRDTNNPFGYGSSGGLYRFASLPNAIDYISERLANADAYVGKTTAQKLATYGPHSNPQYASEVHNIMRGIESLKSTR